MTTALQASVGDATFIKIIDTMVNYPIIVCSFIIVIACIYTACKKPKAFFKLLKSVFTFHFYDRKKVITKKDLINHQLFKDLTFLIDYKLDLLYVQETFQNFDKAKLMMAHDLLKLKLVDVRAWILDLIESTDFEDPYLNLKSLLKNKLDKHNIYIWNEYKKLDIPILFIEKFLEIVKIQTECLSLALNDFLSDSMPLTVYERVFFILSCLSQYYITLVLRMKDVIQSINGDLKGLVYKGQVVGGNNYKLYPVPSREYIPIVQKRLQELSIVSKAKRVSIYVLHDYVGDDYLQGCFSKTYEYESSGFSSILSKFQYKPASLLCDLLSNFKQHQGVIKETDKLNEVFATLLIENGILGIAAYPIFLHDSLRGFICLEFNTLEIFNTIVPEDLLGLLKKYSSLLNIYLDYTKTGFSYSGTLI